MSGIAMMFFQDPSLLRFQKRMEKVKQSSNLKSLFNVSSVPKDTFMREVLDEIGPDHMRAIFSDVFFELQRGKGIEQYKALEYSCIRFPVEEPYVLYQISTKGGGMSLRRERHALIRIFVS
jgi:hypothetical protein